MTDRETYRDPGIARRFKDWVDAEAPTAAPERIVFAVMDEVERSRPRNRAVGPLRLLASVGQYAALTAVIAIGVAIGIVATRTLPGQGQGPGPSPSASPHGAASPGAVPSLATIAAYQIDATTLTTDGGVVWIATAGGDLIGLDGGTGAELHRQSIGFAAADLAVADGVAWAVARDRDIARVNVATSELSTLPVFGATRLALSRGTVWLGSTGHVVAIDAQTGATVRDIGVAGHRDTDPLVVVGNELWVATNVAIQRFQLASGESIGSVPGDATDLLFAGGAVWATRGGELVRIDPLAAGSTFLAGMPDGALLAFDGTNVWVGGSIAGGPGTLISVDGATGTVVSRTPFTGEVRGIGAVGGAAWLATAEDQRVHRFMATP